jgi:exopolysaccharide/PEP-CTERM locus tyrosine autokinase
MSIIEKAMLQLKPGMRNEASAASADRPASRYRTIDLEALQREGIVTPNSAKSRLSEEFRVVKRALLSNAFNRGGGAINNGNLIMVTSALQGEGKTFTAINIAMSIANEFDHTVLLVDTDVAKIRDATFLGMPPGKGLMDLLLDEHLGFHDVLIRTNVPKLNVILAGRQHPHATELLASESMNRLLNEIARRYDDRIVIFDSPPLLATTEASVLAARMGQVVMVIEEGKTPRAAVREALSQIENCKVFGLLNKCGDALAERLFTTYGDYE